MRLQGSLRHWGLIKSVPLPILAVIFLEQVAFIALFFFFTQRYLPQDREMGVAFSGYIITTFALVKLLMQAPSGWLGDRLGHRAVLSAGLLLSLGATFLMMSTYQPSLLLAATAIYALGKAPVSPALNAILADRYEPEQRGRIVAVTSTAGLGATVVAGLSAFVFIDVLSANLLFLISILLTGATLAMVIKHIPDTQRVAAYRRVLWRRLPVQELVSPQVLGWAATLFLIGIAMGLLGPVPRSYSRDVLGRDMVELIPYLILPISVAVLAILPCGVLADKAGRLPPMVIGLGLGAAGLLGIAMTGSLWAIMGLTTLTLLSFTLTSPAAGAAMMDLTRQETRGLLLGALGAVQGLGAAVGPSLGGRIYASVEPQAVFYLAAMLLALAMLVAAAQAVVLQQPKAYALSGA